MATLPDAWQLGVSVWTGWLGASTLSLSESATLICNFYLNMKESTMSLSETATLILNFYLSIKACQTTSRPFLEIHFISCWDLHNLGTKASSRRGTNLLRKQLSVSLALRGKYFCCTTWFRISRGPLMLLGALYFLSSPCVRWSSASRVQSPNSPIIY